MSAFLSHAECTGLVWLAPAALGLLAAWLVWKHWRAMR